MVKQVLRAVNAEGATARGVGLWCAMAQCFEAGAQDEAVGVGNARHEWFEVGGFDQRGFAFGQVDQDGAFVDEVADVQLGNAAPVRVEMGRGVEMGTEVVKEVDDAAVVGIACGNAR